MTVRAITPLVEPTPTRPVSISFFVAGKPQTAGSKTAVPMGNRMGVIEAGTKESRARKRTWRGDLRDAASQATLNVPGGWHGATGAPLHLTIVVVRKRPSAQVGTGRNAGVVKDWALGLMPVERPDTVKIVRATEDALTSWLWIDDSQIVQHSLYKAFGDQFGMSTTAQGLFVMVSPLREYVGPTIGMA